MESIVHPLKKDLSSTVEGLLLFAYGDSLTAMRGGPTYPTRNWFDRVVGRLRSGQGHYQGVTPQAQIANYAVSGWTSVDAVTYAYGTFTAAAGNGPNVAGTFGNAAWQGGLIVPYLGRNDAGYDGKVASSGTTAKHRAGFQNAMIALMRLIRASARTEDTAAAFVYTGTWAANAGAPYCSGGTNHSTTTPGDHCTVTTPVGTDFDLVVLAIDSGGGTSGTPFTVTVDGQPWIPAGYPNTTVDQMAIGTRGVSVCQMAIPLHGLSNAAHTVVITHAGAAGQYLMLDCLLTQSPTPPTILLPKIFYEGAAGYAEYGSLGGLNASEVVDDVYNGIIDTVLGLFPNDGSIITADPNAAGWIPAYGAAGHLSAGDPQAIHPNEAGSIFLADLFMDEINAIRPREGLVTI